MLASAFMAAPSIWCHARGVIRDAGVASAIRRGAHSISVEEEKKKKGKKFECMKRPPVVFWARLWYGWLNWHRGVISPSSILISFSFSLLVLFFFILQARPFISFSTSSKWRVPSWHFLIETLPCDAVKSSRAPLADRNRMEMMKRDDPFSQEINHSPVSMQDIYLYIYVRARKEEHPAHSLLFFLSLTLFFFLQPKI